MNLKLELKLKIETWQTQDQYQPVGKSGLAMSDSVTASGEKWTGSETLEMRHEAQCQPVGKSGLAMI